jgi:hypothetical protein
MTVASHDNFVLAMSLVFLVCGVGTACNSSDQQARSGPYISFLEIRKHRIECRECSVISVPGYTSYPLEMLVEIDPVLSVPLSDVRVALQEGPARGNSGEQVWEGLIALPPSAVRVLKPILSREDVETGTPLLCVLLDGEAVTTLVRGSLPMLVGFGQFATKKEAEDALASFEMSPVVLPPITEQDLADRERELFGDDPEFLLELEESKADAARDPQRADRLREIQALIEGGASEREIADALESVLGRNAPLREPR